MLIRKKKLSLCVGLISVALSFVWISVVIVGISKESEKIRLKEICGQKVTHLLESADHPKVSTKIDHKISIILDDSDGEMRVESLLDFFPQEVAFGVSPYNKYMHKNIALLTDNKRSFLVNIPLSNKKEKKLDLYPDLKSEEISQKIDNIHSMTVGSLGFYSLGNDEFLGKESALEAAIRKIYDLESVFFYGIKDKTATLESEEGSSLKVRPFDVDIGPNKVESGLASLESMALKYGEAVGIVKVNSGNLEVVKRWLSKLSSKNIKIVPAGSLF
jgi:polysaccharide deacetylase 2 family uncharacterized protein YibQ